MFVRSITFVALIALFAVGTFAVSNNVYSVLTTVPTPGTITSSTTRNCMISPSSGAFPQKPAGSVTTSVLAGYTGTIVYQSVTRHLCCAFYGHINHGTGNCENNVCSYTNFDKLAYYGYNNDPLGNLVLKDFGANYFFASTSATLCFPECYEVATVPVTTTEPWVQSGSGGIKTDNFYSRATVPSTTQAISSYRNAWVLFNTDYTTVSNGDYTIPAGLYTGYEVVVTPLVICKGPSGTTGNCPLNGAKFGNFVCKDRGAYDGSNCYLPCGLTLTDTFILDNTSTHVDSFGPFTTGTCFANCVAHA